MGENVDEDFYPCKILADIGDDCYGEADIGGVECCYVVCAEIQVFGKIDCALVVELLRNHDKAAYSINLCCSYYRIEGAIAFAVENDVGRTYAALNERIAHTHHLMFVSYQSRDFYDITIDAVQLLPNVPLTTIATSGFYQMR